MYGYTGKLLEVDLSNKKINEIKIDEEILKQYIGGRGLAVKILWDRIGIKWDSINPFSPENILLILTGPLTGFFPGGRICISGKSPQSNGVVGSTVGGEFGIELKCAGYDGIIISGKAETPCYIFISDSYVEIKRASHIWGKGGKETLKTLLNEGRMMLQKNKLGKWREPAVLYIGPAGERKVRLAAVMSKLTHAAGYGGYGAVMGSKNLKAILVKGTGPLPEVFNIEEVNKLIKCACKECYENQALFRQWGTGYGGYYFGNVTSSEPIKNWQEEWHEEKSYSVTQFERFWVKRYWGDFGCPTTCLKISTFKMNSENIVSDNPDYELQAYLGTNLGIFNPVENIYLSSLIDELGLCGINTGNILGFVGELYEKGILTKEDLDGVELTWGNLNAFALLIKKIAYREGIGDILAEGIYRAALKLSEIKKKDLLKYTVQSKAIAIGAHGVRSGLD
ncbi:MAG: aldehyde ferredoxin oxidoreductase N-terminal domain-containing protein, partial [Candidatus Bathyarchaeia archaeon]